VSLTLSDPVKTKTVQVRGEQQRSKQLALQPGLPSAPLQATPAD
jgi:hypothetical protein